MASCHRHASFRQRLACVPACDRWRTLRHGSATSYSVGVGEEGSGDSCGGESLATRAILEATARKRGCGAVEAKVS